MQKERRVEMIQNKIKVKVKKPSSCGKKIKAKKSEPQDGYKIFNYFKENTAILIAVISALITFIGATLSFALYIRERNYLNYWGYNDIDIIVNSDKQLPFLVLAFVFVFVNILIPLILVKSWENFWDNLIINKYSSIIINESKKINLKSKFLLTKVKIALFFIKRLKNIPKEKAEKIYADIEEVKQDIDTRNDLIKRSKEANKNLAKYCFKELLPSLFLAFFILFLSNVFFILTSLTQVKLYIVFVISMILTFFIILESFFLGKPLNIKEKAIFEKAYKENTEEAKNILKSTLNQGNSNYLVNEVLLGEIKKIRDRDLVFSIFIILISLIFVFFLNFLSIKVETSEKKTFSIADINGQKYVLIYNNENSFYLDEAYISENEIVINTKRQRIISSNDFLTEVKTFNSVEKIDNNEDYNLFDVE